MGTNRLGLSQQNGGNSVLDESANPTPEASPDAPANGCRVGKLRLFIGAAPGVGKTYTMLRQANDLRARGMDIVVGYVDVHDRPETAMQLNDLEIIPRKTLQFQGKAFEEIDVAAILERMPRVVVIDELAHSNVPGSKHAKRYMDVEELLDHGVDVLTAVNVQHIEDVHQEAEEITGMKVREIIPNGFVKRAAEIEIIDVTPETLRQRLRDGSIYPSDKVHQALEHFFRKSNLYALRELALREVADDVDERLQRSFDRNKIPGPIGAKETVLVCVDYWPRAEKLIQRGSRMADMMKADLYTLTFVDVPQRALSAKDQDRLAKIRLLSEQYDAVHIVEQRNERILGAAILELAESLNITQIVIGQPKAYSKWAFWRQNPVKYLMQHMKYVDVRIVGWKE